MVATDIKTRPFIFGSSKFDFLTCYIHSEITIFAAESAMTITAGTPILIYADIKFKSNFATSYNNNSITNEKET